jgi:hypothetical protein
MISKRIQLARFLTLADGNCGSTGLEANIKSSMTVYALLRRNLCNSLDNRIGQLSPLKDSLQTQRLSVFK